MVDNSWIADLQTTVYSRLKAIGKTKISSQIKFTTLPVDTTDAVFPTVYVHELAPVETNRDLEGITVNSIVYSIQIEVFANDTNKVEAKQISYILLDIMKSMMFEATSLPLPDYGTNVTRCVTRYRRNISRDDII